MFAPGAARDHFYINWLKVENNFLISQSPKQATVELNIYMLRCSLMSDSVIPWTIACQAPLSCLWVSPQEYWSRWPFPPQGIFLEGLSPSLLPLLHCQEDSLPLGPPGQPCSGLRGGPKRYAHPLLVNVTLFDKRVFADAMKSRTSG